jgi:transposase
MKPYSIDLRQKIVDAYAAGGISQKQVAANFGVALSFVSKLILSQRRYNTIEPRVRLLQTPSKLSDKQLETLRQIVLSNPDGTLSEFRQYLFNETDVLLSISSIDRIIRTKLAITYKKKVYSQARKQLTQSKKLDSSMAVSKRITFSQFNILG